MTRFPSHYATISASPQGSMLVCVFAPILPKKLCRFFSLEHIGLLGAAFVPPSFFRVPISFRIWSFAVLFRARRARCPCLRLLPARDGRPHPLRSFTYFSSWVKQRRSPSCSQPFLMSVFPVFHQGASLPVVLYSCRPR